MSSIISFKENKVAQIDALVPLPELSAPDSAITNLAKASLEEAPPPSLRAQPPELSRRSTFHEMMRRSTRCIILKDVFVLSFLENQLVLEMFKERSCDKVLNLLHLFGVSLYDKIVALSPFLSAEQLNHSLQDLSSIFFDIHKYQEGQEEVIRNKISDVELRNFHFPPISSSRSALAQLKENLLRELDAHKKIEQTKKQLLVSKITDPARRQKMQISIRDEATQSVLPIKKACALIDIFIKILNHEHRNYIFRSIEHFEDAENCGDQQKILQHLQIYANFYAMIYDQFRSSYALPGLHGKRPFVQLASFFHKMQEGAPLTRERAHIVKRMIDKLKSSLAVIVNESQKLQSGKEEISEASQCAKLFAVEVKAAALLLLVTQVESIVDHEIILPSFPGFSPIATVLHRCSINIRSCPSEIPHNEPIPFPANFVEEFQNYFCALISPIELAFDPLIQGINALMQTRANGQRPSLEPRSYRDIGHWQYLQQIMLLFPEETFNNISARTVATSLQLIQFFQDHEPLLQSIETAEKEKIIGDIQSIYWEKTLFLRRIMMIVGDWVDVTKNTFSLDPKYAPLERTDSVMLNQLHELLGVACSPAEEVEISSIDATSFECLDEEALDQLLGPPSPPVELEVEDPALPPAGIELDIPEILGAGAPDEEKGSARAVALPILPPLRARLVSAAASRFSNNAAKPVKVTAPKSPLPLSPGMLEMTKTREILVALGDAGFFVGRNGPHIIMTDKHGRIVPVPRRREQKTGTVYKMYQLATAGIKRPKE